MSSYLSNIQNKIYVGNLSAAISPAFLFEIFSNYGRVVSVQKRYPTYAFVEFEDQESARKAIDNTNGIELCGKKIFVNKAKNEGKNCDKKSKIKSFSCDGEIETQKKIDEGDEKQSESFSQEKPEKSLMIECQNMKVACCEIIAEGKVLRPFAEKIEEILMNLGISCDIVFMNPTFDKAKVLGQFRENKSFYTIILTHENVTFNSFTLVFLQGESVEHHNIPYIDGLNLLVQDFQLRQKSSGTVNELQTHPDHISKFLNVLIVNSSLTVTQYDSLIHYLNDRKQEQIKFEIGESFWNLKAKKDEKNLQDKIFNILKEKIPKVEISSHSMNEIEKSNLIDKIKTDERVQNVMKIIKEKL